MKFGMEKCDIIIMKKEKRETIEVTELPNRESIRIIGEKENYKYLGILDVDTIKQREMKEKLRKVNHRKTRKLLEIKLCRWNLKVINSKVTIFLRCFR